MAYTTINKSSLFHNAVTWSGNNAARTISGVGFQPDWIWWKQRNGGDSHRWADSVRGEGSASYKLIFSDDSSAEYNGNDNGGSQGNINAITSDGFSGVQGTSGYNNWNGNSFNYVAWNWKAGTTSGLSGGTITPTGYSINATSGFGIYKYTGNGTSGATIAHGLGKAPKMIIVKRLDSSPEWQIYHTRMGNTKWIELTTGTPQTGTSRWNDTSPTNTLFYLGNDSDVNYNGGNYIAYAFADIRGYSKFSYYVGNGDASGPFVYTGFKPSLVMIKRISGSDRWVISDNKRDPDNPVNGELNPNDSATEDTSDTPFDFLSNGFKLRRVGNVFNGSGEEYIYMAFGQSLVGSNNVPATAR